MDYSQFILAVNAASIAILTLFTILLLVSSKFKGMNGYAALVTFVPTVPVYLYNMSRMLSWHGFAHVVMPVAFSVNTTLMPLLWILVRINYDSGYRWDIRKCIHFLPFLACLILILSIGSQQRMEVIEYEMTGQDTWLGTFNACLVMAQMLIYYPAIFIYLSRVRKRIAATASDAEWLQKRWMYRFQYLFFILFVIVEVCYFIWPRTDAWLIQIINVVSMTYLVWCSLTHPSMPMSPVEPLDKTPAMEASMSMEEMKEVCDLASAYLKESKAYLRPDISLYVFAKGAGIAPRTLSRAINGYLNINFFEFINRMRVEEAKTLLLELDSKGYNIDSIYDKCGFRSRSTFFLVFKKVEGVTPAVWLESASKNA